MQHPDDHGRWRVLAGVLTSAPFLLALSVLLLNDLVLKAAAPGLVTGKLSDFAGLAVIALPVFAFWPRHRLFSGLVIAAAFLWWKGPWSGAFIQGVNAHLPVVIGRTIDFSDLIAISVLPLCVRGASPRPWRSPGWLRRLAVVPVAGITLLAVMGTSVVPVRQEYSFRSREEPRQLPRADIVSAIRAVADRRGMTCVGCSQPQESGTWQGDNITLAYRFDERGAVVFVVGAMPTSFFGTSGLKKADEVRAELKREMAARVKSLDYVEPLPGSQQ